MRISPTELLIVLAIVVIIFGPKQLPKLAKMFGKTAKSFKEGVADEENAENKDEAKTESSEKTEDKAE